MRQQTSWLYVHGYCRRDAVQWEWRARESDFLPGYRRLEGFFELIVANAQHVKTVSGRKTDVQDADWIADLLQHGLLSPSFVPNQEQQDLRDLTRLRVSLVQERSRLVNRVRYPCSTRRAVSYRLSEALFWASRGNASCRRYV